MTTKTINRVGRVQPLYLFVLGVVFFIVLLGLLRAELVKQNVNQSLSRPEAITISVTRELEIRKTYEEKVRPIIIQLSKDNNSGAFEGRSAVLLKRVSAARDSLLALTVPSEYKEFHLNLIIALSILEQGYQGDVYKIEVGQAKLRTVMADLPWQP